MAVKSKPAKSESQRGGGSNTIYGIGLIGAWVYYFQRASTNQERVEAFFKGLVWPAFLVHDMLVFLSKEKPPLDS